MHPYFGCYEEADSNFLERSYSFKPNSPLKSYLERHASIFLYGVRHPKPESFRLNHIIGALICALGNQQLFDNSSFLKVKDDEELFATFGATDIRANDFLSLLEPHLILNTSPFQGSQADYERKYQTERLLIVYFLHIFGLRYDDV